MPSNDNLSNDTSDGSNRLKKTIAHADPQHGHHQQTSSEQMAGESLVLIS